MTRKQPLTDGLDQRARRTRAALLQAFFGLALSRPFEEISVAVIVARAGVGRSTFYEHFRGKNGLLAASLAGPFGVLADAIRPEDNTRALTAQLEHFWQNRAVARGLLTGPMRSHSVAVLARLVRQRLRASRPAAGRLPIPAALAAIQIAEALFAPMAAWLTVGPACPAPRLARSLRHSARALIAALGVNDRP